MILQIALGIVLGFILLACLPMLIYLALIAGALAVVGFVIYQLHQAGILIATIVVVATYIGLMAILYRVVDWAKKRRERQQEI